MSIDREVYDVHPGDESMQGLAREWKSAIETLLRDHGLVLSEGFEGEHDATYYISDEKHVRGSEQVDLSKKYYAKLQLKGNVHGRNHYRIVKGDDELKEKDRRCAVITGIRALILMDSEPYLEVGMRDDWVINSIASSQLSPREHIISIYKDLLN